MENNILAVGLLIGFVNVVQLTFPKVVGLWAFLLSVCGGIALGFLHWYGVMSIEQGVLLAFVASGLYKMGQVAGNVKKTEY